MNIIYSNNAILDIQFYKFYSKKYLSNLNKYIYSLLDTIDLLSYNPRLGKLISQSNNFEIRQLIHKEHRIFYTILNNKILILSLIHVLYPYDETLNSIKLYLSNL